MVTLEMIEDAAEQRAACGDDQSQKAGARPGLKPDWDFECEGTQQAKQEKLWEITSPRELSTTPPLRRDISEYCEGSKMFDQPDVYADFLLCLGYHEA